MPIDAIYPATVDVAGGIRYGGQDYFVGHQTGNVEGKRVKLRNQIQGLLDLRVNTKDFPVDDPDGDPAQNPTWNTYDDLNTRPDSSLIDELQFYYQQNPQNLIMVTRPVLADIYLAVANDPSIGGEDRYELELQRLA